MKYKIGDKVLVKNKSSIRHNAKNVPFLIHFKYFNKVVTIIDVHDYYNFPYSILEDDNWLLSDDQIKCYAGNKFKKLKEIL
jgi:hypothetical protein